MASNQIPNKEATSFNLEHDCDLAKANPKVLWNSDHTQSPPCFSLVLSYAAFYSRICNQSEGEKYSMEENKVFSAWKKHEPMDWGFSEEKSEAVDCCHGVQSSF